MEKSLGFLCCTTQLVGAHFQQLPARAQQREWQRRISTRSQDEMEVRRKALDDVPEGGVDLLVGDDVIVIQDQHKVLGTVLHTVDEYCQHGDQWWGNWRLQGLQHRSKA